MSDELKERNILKLILSVRFACTTLDVGHPILVELHCLDELAVILEDSRVDEALGASVD
jgi:hypothetical protein